MVPHLPQASVSRVGRQDMAHHPCSRVPSVARPVDPEKVDVSVEIRLQVPRRHPREAPKVALEPGTRVVHHLHPLRVDRVVDLRPVHLAVETSLPDQHAEGMLEIMDEQRPESRPVTAAAGRMHGQYLRCGGIGPHGEVHPPAHRVVRRPRDAEEPALR